MLRLPASLHLPASGACGTLRSVLLLWLLLWPPGAASADWLVGPDGERVETRGPWEVKRSVVVFTLADGTFSSLRLADVDLEASARATAEALASPAAPAPPKAAPARREPVLVLTTEDVGRAAEPAEVGDPEGPAGESPELEDAAAVSAPEPVEVISWDRREGPDIGRFEISGVLRNNSASIVTDVGVQVSLLDHRGQVMARSNAFLDAVSVAARATTTFKALFSGIDSFDGEPRFEVRSRKLLFEAAGENRASEWRR